MAPCRTALTHKYAFLSRAGRLTCRPISHFRRQSQIPANPIQPSGIRSFRCHPHSCPFNSNHGLFVSKNWYLGFSQPGGFESSRVSAVSDTGSGGTGGTGGSGRGNFGEGRSGSGGDGADGGSAGKGPSFLSWYLSLLEAYPMPVKALTSALLTLIGDLTCQLVIDRVPSLDLKRTFIFTLLGFMLVGPTLHLWYLYLSKMVPTPGTSGAFLRLLLDQFLFAPTFIAIFLAMLVTLEGRPSQAIPKLQQEWFSAVLANWQLWIPFQFLNFRFVPQQFQVLAANVVSLAWNVILSFKAHKEILSK